MNKENVVTRLKEFKKLLKENGIDYYLIPTGDYHGSEYVSEYFKVREYFSGFTGSNGTLLVGMDETCLWTDGRYFIQAEKELEGTGIILQKMGETGVKTVTGYLNSYMKEGESLGFDGRVLSMELGIKLEKAVKEKKGKMFYDKDLADSVFWNRPVFEKQPVMVLDEKLCGSSFADKIEKIREKMKENHTGMLVLSRLDDIMWLFNLRGSDVRYNPVAFCFAIVSMEEVYLFTDNFLQNKALVSKAKKEKIRLLDYEIFYEKADSICGKETVWLPKDGTPYALYKKFDEEKVYIGCNPVESEKAVKNEKELENIRKFYIKDSVAVTKFIYRMKQERSNIENGKKMTEYDALMIMDALREEIPDYLYPSFKTISAYGKNAAMMHYEADEKNSALLKSEGMLLVDSGGQYLGATTDVTRTIAMGRVTDDMKLNFSKVLEGMLALANARFLYGCTGRNLDILARRPLWEMGIDYKCGTGHGVGYILNVHEGPQNIRYKYTPGEYEAVLEAGMLVTDEPGVYKEGEYGIRTENVLLVQKDIRNSDGQFMKFEMLTFVPIDLELVDVKYLDKKTRDYLNEYHRQVYEKISPHLTEEEGLWLKENTKNVDG